MILSNSKTNKATARWVSLALVVFVSFVVFFSLPQKAAAVIPVHDYVADAATTGLHLVVKTFIKMVTDRIKSSILNPGDGNNGPAYITNWRSYMQEIETQGIDVGKQLAGAAAYGIAGNPDSATICEYMREDVGRASGAKEVPNEESAQSLQKYQSADGGDFQNKVKCTLPAEMQTKEKMQDYVNGVGFTWDLFGEVARPENNPAGVMSMITSEIARNQEAQKESKLNQAVADQGFRPFVTATDIIKSPGSYVKRAADVTVSSAIDCAANLNVWNPSQIGTAIGSCLSDVLTSSLENFGGIKTNSGTQPTVPPQVINEQWNQDQCNAFCDQEAQTLCQINGGLATWMAQCLAQSKDNCLASHANNGCRR